MAYWCRIHVGVPLVSYRCDIGVLYVWYWCLIGVLLVSYRYPIGVSLLSFTAIDVILVYYRCLIVLCLIGVSKGAGGDLFLKFYFARCWNGCRRATFFYILSCQVLKRWQVGIFFFYKKKPSLLEKVGVGLFFTFIFWRRLKKGSYFFLNVCTCALPMLLWINPEIQLLQWNQGREKKVIWMDCYTDMISIVYNYILCIINYFLLLLPHKISCLLSVQFLLKNISSSIVIRFYGQIMVRSSVYMVKCVVFLPQNWLVSIPRLNIIVQPKAPFTKATPGDWDG